MKKRFSGVIIALFFIWQCLLFGGLGWALPALANQKIQIPSQYGSIKEVFSAQNTAEDRERTIIHIQDAHCNYEAQKNMAGLLEYLIKEYNLRLIMVEGGSGDVSLAFLRGYADEKAKAEVADKYLKEGKISGEEYLDIVSDYPLELYGIEDEGFYDAHLTAFEKIDSFREEGLRDLEGLSRIIENLKPFIYSEELRRFEEMKKRYEAKTMPLAQYCQNLEGMARSKGLNLNGYYNLVSFSEVARLEKEIDFKEAESQRNTFIKDLANLLDEEAVKELLDKSQEFKAKNITPQEYYSFLKTAGELKIDLRQNYPQFDSYINYINISKNIDTKDLLKEISAIEEKIKEASFTNDDQRKLSGIAKSLQVLTKVLNLELAPEDYDYFQANKPQFITASWRSFLSENCKKYNLAMQPPASLVIDENLQQLEEFYKLGLLREKAFIKNMTSKMEGSGQKLAVLITGGFHTSGITQMLKEKGYSYVVAAPVITQKSDPSIYFSVLRGKKNQPEEITDDEE